MHHHFKWLLSLWCFKSYSSGCDERARGPPPCRLFCVGLQGKPWLIFLWQTRDNDFFLPGTCEPMRYSLSWKQVTHRVVTIAHVWYSWHENECVSSANHCISVSGIVGTWLPKPWPVARCAEDVPGQVPYRLSTGWQFWRSLRLQRIPGAVKILLDRCIQFIKNGQQAFVLADAWQQGNEHDQQDSWLSAARNHLNQRPFLQPDKMCFFRTSHFSTSVCAFQNTLQTASDFSFFFQVHGEVCLKKHVSRLVANNKYRETPKFERSRNVELRNLALDDDDDGWMFFVGD